MLTSTKRRLIDARGTEPLLLGPRQHIVKTVCHRGPQKILLNSQHATEKTHLKKIEIPECLNSSACIEFSGRSRGDKRNHSPDFQSNQREHAVEEEHLNPRSRIQRTRLSSATAVPTAQVQLPRGPPHHRGEKGPIRISQLPSVQLTIRGPLAPTPEVLVLHDLIGTPVDGRQCDCMFAVDCRLAVALFFFR